MMYTKKIKHSELWQTAPFDTVLSFLKYGADKGIHLGELCRYTGLDNRTLRKTIETIRRSGICILSGVRGYYFPLNKREVERYIQRTERTARSHFYTLHSAKAALKRFEDEEAGA